MIKYRFPIVTLILITFWGFIIAGVVLPSTPEYQIEASYPNGINHDVITKNCPAEKPNIKTDSVTQIYEGGIPETEAIIYNFIAQNKPPIGITLTLNGVPPGFEVKIGFECFN